MGTGLVSTKEREKIVMSTCLKKMNPVLREHGFSEVSRTMPVCVGLWRNAQSCLEEGTCVGSWILPCLSNLHPKFSLLLFLQEAQIDGFVYDGLRKE